MKTVSILCGISFLLVCGNRSATAASITFQTGSFNPSEWSSHILASSTGTAVATTEASGGNSGAYRRVSLSVGNSQSVLDAELWSGAQFDPSSQGAVTSVSLSYDVARVFTSNPFATQIARGIAVQQDGVIYYYLGGVTTQTPPNWNSFSVLDIVPLFSGINWINGSTITFGFFDSVSGSNFTIDGGYDNFGVQVNFAPASVPDSGSTALMFVLGIGALGLLARRGFTMSS